MKLFKSSTVQDSNEGTTVVADLDALIQKSVGFRLNGKTHTLKAMTTRVFLEVCEGLGALDKIQKQIKAGMDVSEYDMMSAYHGVFKDACSSMTTEDLLGLNHQQRAVLLQLILKHVGGQTHVEEAIQKKNT